MLPWLVALAGIEDIKKVVVFDAKEDSEVVTTAGLATLCIFFFLCCSLFESKAPTFLYAIPAVAAGAIVNIFNEWNPIEFGFTPESVTAAIVGATVFFACIAVHRSVSHCLFKESPMAPANFPAWLGASAVTCAFGMMMFTLLAHAGKLALHGKVECTEDSVVCEDLATVFFYYSLRWASSVLFVFSVKLDQLTA